MKKILAFTLVGIVSVVVTGCIAVKSGNADIPSADTTSSATTATASVSESAVDVMVEITEAVVSTTKEEKTKLADKISSFFEKTTAAKTTKAPETLPANTIEDYAYAYAGFNPVYANVEISDWKMLLVNRDYILPDDYEVELAPCITDDPDSLKLDYRVAPHYNEMYLAALEDGIELTPVSGYRSVARQKRNFENKIQKYVDDGYSKVEATQMAATIILPPGTSEHNAGLAMDICSLYESFENTDEFKWLNENAADYGFILRYPKDKQDITRIIYEPWHWRYVGVEAAKEMKASGQCFEEYLGVVN